MTADASPNAGIALLGLGIMGTGMAHSMRRAGIDLTVWNRSEPAVVALAEAGAGVAASPAEAARGASVVITMLSDAAATSAVISDAWPGLSPDAIWIQMGTIGLAATAELAERAQGAGITFVDAPVAGTRQPAMEGKLTIMAAGPESARDRCTPIFDAVGQKTVWVSETPGDATRLKLVVNGWLTTLMAGLAESLELATRLGLDPAAFLDFIDGGTLGIPYAQVKGKAMIARSFPTSFSAANARKDVGLVTEAAGSVGLDLGVATAVGVLFDRAIAAGHGDDDMAAIITGLDG